MFRNNYTRLRYFFVQVMDEHNERTNVNSEVIYRRQVGAELAVSVNLAQRSSNRSRENFHLGVFDFARTELGLLTA